MFLTVLITLVCMLIHLQPLVLINVLNTLISMLIHYPNHASWSVLTAITPTMSLVRVFKTAPPILPYTSLISKPACAISTALVLSSDKSALVYANLSVHL